jgi:hypothetical protein
MPPSLKLGTPILIDLDALHGRAPGEVIDLEQMRGLPEDAILLDDVDPLTVLIAGTRRKTRR